MQFSKLETEFENRHSIPLKVGKGGLAPLVALQPLLVPNWRGKFYPEAPLSKPQSTFEKRHSILLKVGKVGLPPLVALQHCLDATLFFPSLRSGRGFQRIE